MAISALKGLKYASSHPMFVTWPTRAWAQRVAMVISGLQCAPNGLSTEREESSEAWCSTIIIRRKCYTLTEQLIVPEMRVFSKKVGTRFPRTPCIADELGRGAQRKSALVPNTIRRHTKAKGGGSNRGDRRQKAFSGRRSSRCGTKSSQIRDMITDSSRPDISRDPAPGRVPHPSRSSHRMSVQDRGRPQWPSRSGRLGLSVFRTAGVLTVASYR